MVEQNTESQNPGVLAKTIRVCAENPFFTILTVLALVVWGYYAMRKAPLDAIPDLSDVQVIVFTEWPGQSPDIIEDQVTYPISSSLLAAPKVRYVRGQSFLGLSFVNVIFEDGTDMYWARSRVLEYLNSITGKLPASVSPTLGPDATGVGWVFQYALVDRSGKNDLAKLRSLQDWNIRYALESVDGVAEVASAGGFVKQYQIIVDPKKLFAHKVTINQVVTAVRRSNKDVGGRVLEIAGHEQVIRGRGYIKSLSDIENVPVKIAANGVPILVKNIAKVALGPDMRRGVIELNGEGEAVGGIVVMRYGENALKVINAVKERIKDIKQGLPEGVEFVVTYDRSELILNAIDTLKTTLIEELIVVSLIITIFLLHFRSSFIAIITLPIAVILSFIPMSFHSLTANIMSLGGIAVAIGAMVDAAIIIIENIHKKLEHEEEDLAGEERREIIIDAIQEVGPSLFFSLLIITVSFLPVFSLEGTAGRLFRPLAFTKTYSMGFSAILAITLVPALSVLLIRGKIRSEKDNRLNSWLISIYQPIVHFVVRFRYAVIGTSVLLVLSTLPVFFSLESEFMPPLNEGSILYMPTAPPGMSIADATKTLQAMDRIIKSLPEVESVFGKAGRARTATDPAPLSMFETVIMLKSKSKWRPGKTWDGIIEELDNKLKFPGMPNVWWMPIQTRTEMLATGIRSALGIKVFGSSFQKIEQAGVEIEKALLADPRTAPFTRSAFAERVTGGYYLDFNVKRLEAARYGLTVDDVQDTIMSAIGGMNITDVVDGRERYPVQVRYGRDFRNSPDTIGKVLVATKTGTQIPLSHVADISFATGPPMIRSEDGQLTSFVFVDVTNKAIADYVNAAKAIVAEKVSLPDGVRIAWAGQYQYLERAKEKLSLVIPLTLAIIFLLLYLNTKSVVEVCIVLLAVPFSLIGAVWLLYVLDYNMSVAVWVGIIALAGLDAETGVIMLLYLTLAHKARQAKGQLSKFEDLEEAIVEGAAHRIRPKLMTVLTAFIGLIPVMLSTGTGADVMKRVAAPMVGGLATSFILELTVYPALFAVWKSRELDRFQSS